MKIDNKSEKIITELLARADIKVGGDRPWDIQVKNIDLYQRIIRDRSIGLGETYMEGWWECEKLDQFFDKLLKAKLSKKLKGMITASLIKSVILSHLSNRQTKNRALQVGEEHYDIGNDLYEKMLDKRLTYTCGYWKDAKNLDEAQEAKLDLICKKAGLKKGMKILDIGCGWGSFVKFAVEKYGVSAVGITISKEQVKLAQENVAGLDVEIRFQDYRDVDEKFDAIISVGMFEHVGRKNFREYMKIVHKNLNSDGIFLLHTIGKAETQISPYDPWIDKYIFPNGTLPSQSEITKSIDRLFIMEDWHNFGTDYDKTLMAWHDNFTKNWDSIKSNYNDKFYMMWVYYLLCCAGNFRSRNMQLWQIVLSKDGVEGGHKSIR